MRLVAAARAKKEKEPVGPDDLVRASAGAYRSGDGRFEVTKSDVGWYLVDTQQSNEFGQQLIHGPMPTLEAVREAVPGARVIKPLLRVRPPAAGKRPQSTPQRPAPPPRSWIDELPAKDAAAAKRLIKALEREGVDGAEGLVRHHRDDASPTVATKIVERRLRALIDEQPEAERERALHLVSQATRILADGGATVPAPAPRWALVEVTEDEQPRRRITPRV